MACNFKHAQVIKQVFFFFALNVKIKTVRLENHHVMKIKKKKKKRHRRAGDAGLAGRVQSP